VLDSVANTTIGGATAAERNVISGNGSDGVRFDSSGTGNVVQGNFIGTNKGGNADLGNRFDGVQVLDTVDILIDANLISGNDQHGVEVSRTSSAPLTGNTIGLAQNGVAVLANGTPQNSNSGDGVDVNSGATAFIGGITAAQRNVISGNRRDGVRFD